MRLDHYVKLASLLGLMSGLAIPAIFLPLFTADARDLLRSPSQPVFCRELQRHVPDADVAFEPGRDTRGRAVASADLPNQTAFQLPETFRFPLTVDVIERLGLDERQLGVEGDLPLGEVVVEGGRVSFDGAVVDGLSRADVVALCARKPVVQ